MSGNSAETVALGLSRRTQNAGFVSFKAACHRYKLNLLEVKGSIKRGANAIGGMPCRVERPRG